MKKHCECVRESLVSWPLVLVVSINVLMFCVLKHLKHLCAKFAIGWFRRKRHNFLSASIDDNEEIKGGTNVYAFPDNHIATHPQRMVCLGNRMRSVCACIIVWFDSFTYSENFLERVSQWMVFMRTRDPKHLVHIDPQHTTTKWLNYKNKSPGRHRRLSPKTINLRAAPLRAQCQQGRRQGHHLGRHQG